MLAAMNRRATLILALFVTSCAVAPNNHKPAKAMASC
jgi:hypothetical protein